jgi:hypothetical protein
MRAMVLPTNSSSVVPLAVSGGLGSVLPDLLFEAILVYRRSSTNYQEMAGNVSFIHARAQTFGRRANFSHCKYRALQPTL